MIINLHPYHLLILKKLILKKHQKDINDKFTSQEIKFIIKNSEQTVASKNTLSRLLLEKPKNNNNKITIQNYTIEQIIQYCYKKINYSEFIKCFNIPNDIKILNGRLISHLKQDELKKINDYANERILDLPKITTNFDIFFQKVIGSYYTYFKFRGTPKLARAKAKLYYKENQLMFDYQIFDYNVETFPVEFYDDCLYLKVHNKTHNHIITSFALKIPAINNFELFISHYLTIANYSKLPKSGTEIFVKYSNNIVDFDNLTSKVIVNNQENESEKLINKFLQIDRTQRNEYEYLFFSELQKTVDQLLTNN